MNEFMKELAEWGVAFAGALVLCNIQQYKGTLRRLNSQLGEGSSPPEAYAARKEADDWFYEIAGFDYDKFGRKLAYRKFRHLHDISE